MLDDFEMEMLDDGPRPVKKKDFIQFVKARYSQNTSNIVLEALFPKGSKWKAHGMITNIELNGKVGFCIGVNSNQRVGVEF